MRKSVTKDQLLDMLLEREGYIKRLRYENRQISGTLQKILDRADKLQADAEAKVEEKIANLERSANEYEELKEVVEDLQEDRELMLRALNMIEHEWELWGREQYRWRKAS